jgi:hypothetical protein
MSFLSNIVPVLFVLPIAAAIAQENQQGARICLVPTKAEMVTGNTETAITAVRETFTSFLTGPSLGVTPLEARLASQAREEAKQKTCPYVLLTTIKHQRKQDRGLLGRATAGAVEAGAWQVIGSSPSREARVAAGAVASAAVAARDVAYAFKVKDELELTYRLESADGTVLLDKTEKRTAKSDGEDVLTPVVEKASEAIAATITRGGK